MDPEDLEQMTQKEDKESKGLGMEASLEQLKQRVKKFKEEAQSQEFSSSFEATAKLSAESSDS